jgi:hypothetical protein
MDSPETRRPRDGTLRRHGSPDRTAVTLAECVRGAGDPINPMRVPGSRHRPERGGFAPHADAVRRVLPRVADASVAPEGRALASPGRATRARLGRAIPQVGGRHHRYDRRAA